MEAVVTAEQTYHIHILSVGDARRQAPDFIRNNDDRVLLMEISKVVLSDDSIVGDNADYHNLAATYARLDDYVSAYKIVAKGLKQFPYDVDLLADAVKYGSKCGEIAICKEYLSTLLERPFEYWNWRTFTFVIDFYLLSITWEDPNTIEETLKEALKIAKEYQRLSPTEERGFIAEAEIYLATSNIEDAIEVLKKAIYECPNILSPQCCIKYADILAERGEFEKVIEVCTKGLIVTAQDQPTARTGYFCYLSALAKDALIHQDKAFGDEKRIADALTDYKTAYKLLKTTSSYTKNICDRVEILSAKSGVSFSVDDNFSEKKIDKLVELLSTDNGQ